MNKDKIIQGGALLIIIICLGVAGWILIGPSKSTTADQNQAVGGLAPMVDGKQLIKTTVHAEEYSPNYFKVKVGVPVRFEVTSSGEPGCDSGAMVSTLFSGGSLYLNPTAGQVATTEFTPQTPGVYGFSCTMGMVRGKIEVVN